MRHKIRTKIANYALFNKIVTKIVTKSLLLVTILVTKLFSSYIIMPKSLKIVT